MGAPIAKNPSPKTLETGKSTMDTSKWQILIVEDEHDSSQMVADILRYHGIEVYQVGNGHECLAIIHKVEPTLVVMDLAMPKKDGWQTLHELRADAATSYIPVVAITAYHSASVAEDAIAAGFNAYFPKPIEPTSFVFELERIVAGG